MNYGFSRARKVYIRVKLVNDQRLDGVVEILDPFHLGCVGSIPVRPFVFFKILMILEWQKRDDPLDYSEI